jgi:carboxypeptidase Q
VSAARGRLGRRRLLAAAACGLVAPMSSAQSAAPLTADDLAHAVALRDRALGDRHAWPLLQALCTEVGARPAGSPADARAVQWAVAAATRLGLANVRAEPVPLRVWQRGPGRVELTAPLAQPLVALAIGNSPATPEGGIEAEVAAYADLDALLADTSDRPRGRIVFVDQKTERTIDGRGYGAAVRARFGGPLEAAKRGALALVIRSIGTSRDPVAHTGAMRFEAGLPLVPTVALSVPDADVVARLVATGAPVRMKLVVQARQGVEALTHNVIAEVPGRGPRAGEIVLIGAHLDSWDVGQGAQDDGAGVAIVLAAAKHLLDAGGAPARTVRVVLFGNEENGFDGARAYGDRYGAVRHQLVGESDFGAGRVWRLRSRVASEALPAVEALAGLLAPLGIAAGGNDGSPGPDAGVLMRRHRWPAIDLTQDGTAYFDVHHTENDTLARIDPATLPQNVAAWATTAWVAAQADVAF